jgi:Capsular polysaccharide biosynthesis protein
MILLELKEYLQVILKRWKIIAAVTIISVVGSGIISVFFMKPVYEAKITLIVGSSPSNSNNKIQYNDIMLYQQMLKTYSEMIKRRVTSENTLAKLNYDMKPEELMGKLKVTATTGSQIIDVSIQDSSAERACNLANTLGTVFEDEAKTYMNSTDVKVLDKAVVPKSPVSPNKKMNVAIGFLLGIMVSLGIVFIIEYLDNTIKTENDVKEILDLPILATIPYVKEK